MTKNSTSSVSPLRLHLNQDKLETFRQVSPAVFASAVHGASINGDVSSLEEVIRYLAESNAQGLDGASLLGAEHFIQAYKQDGNGKIKEVKGKEYLYTLLFAPLRQQDAVLMEGNPAAKEYAESVLGLVKLLKMDTQPLAAAVRYLTYGSDHAPYAGIVDRLIEHMGSGSALLDVVHDAVQASKRRRHDLPAGAPSAQMFLSRANYLVHTAMKSNVFCEALAREIRTEVHDGSIDLLIKPQMEELRVRMGNQWPAHEGLREQLQDIFAVNAMRELNSRHRHNLSHKDVPYLDPLDSGAAATLSPAEYLARYAQIEKSVPLHVSRSAHNMILVSYSPQEDWDGLEPLQHRVDSHGGHPFWPSLLIPGQTRPLSTERLAKAIENHGPHSINACTEALCAVGAHLKVFRGKSEYVDQFAPALLAHGADPRENRYRQSFTDTMTPSDLATRPDVDRALKASLARLAFEESSKVRARKKPAIAQP